MWRTCDTFPQRLASPSSALASVCELMRLSLVGTVHEENGLANVEELLAILECLTPDVIFAEIPTAEADQYRNGSHGSLESMAVARHREGRQIAVVPVDLTKPEDAFFQCSRDMFKKVERTSPHYRRMIDRNSYDTQTGGFPYLNSDRCIKAWAAIRGEVLDTLEWINEPQMREIYDCWNRQHALRDTEMVKNIAEYAVRNRFVHGVFLVGTAHMQSIIEKTRVESVTAIARIEWEVDVPLLGRT